MNLIIIKDETEYVKDVTIQCPFNNERGLKGLYNSQMISGFKNGLENIEDIDTEIDNLFKTLRNTVLDNSIKYKLNRSNIFKVILNLFIIKIKYYNITQSDCVKYIYHYFEHYDLNKYGSTISKLFLVL